MWRWESRQFANDSVLFLREALRLDLLNQREYWWRERMFNMKVERLPLLVVALSLGIVFLGTTANLTTHGAEIVALKDGRKVIVDQVVVERQEAKTHSWQTQTKEDQIICYRKNMKFRKSGTTWDGSPQPLSDEFVIIGTYNWDQLADESIQKYFPDKWAEILRKRQAAAPLPAPKPIIPPPVQEPPVAHRAPVQPLPAAPSGEPQVPISALVDTGTEASDLEGKFKISQFRGAVAEGEAFVFEGRISVLSSKPIYDLSIFCKAGELKSLVTIASELKPEDALNLQAGAFRIPLDSKPDFKSAWCFLIVSYFEQPATGAGRKALTVTFRVEETEDGKYRLQTGN